MGDIMFGWFSTHAAKVGVSGGVSTEIGPGGFQTGRFKIHGDSSRRDRAAIDITVHDKGLPTSITLGRIEDGELVIEEVTDKFVSGTIWTRPSKPRTRSSLEQKPVGFRAKFRARMVGSSPRACGFDRTKL
jgi:hypothetical protein